MTAASSRGGQGQPGRAVTRARPGGRARGYWPYPRAGADGAGAGLGGGGAGGSPARTFPACARICAAAAAIRSPAAVTSPSSGLRGSPPAQACAGGNAIPAAAGSRPSRASTSQATESASTEAVPDLAAMLSPAGNGPAASPPRTGFPSRARFSSLMMKASSRASAAAARSGGSPAGMVMACWPASVPARAASAGRVTW